MMNRKSRCDFFYFIAKKFKFRSRAAFKLIEMNRRFFFLKNSLSILDLCAAPGSWMQVSRELSPPCASITGVDIYPIKEIKGCRIIKADITSSDCIQLILKEFNSFEKKLNVILHDGSPRIGTMQLLDVYKQNELIINAFKFAKIMLCRGGWFITKIFKSTYFGNILFILKYFFKNIFIFKPVASRCNSIEIYLICKNYLKNWIKYYPMLSIKIVFKEFLFKKKKSKFRNKESVLKKNLHFVNLDSIKKDEFECLFGTNFYDLNLFQNTPNIFLKKNHISENWVKSFF